MSVYVAPLFGGNDEPVGFMLYQESVAEGGKDTPFSRAVITSRRSAEILAQQINGLLARADPQATAPKREVEIQTDIVALDDVIRYFVRGYEKSGEIIDHKYFVDTAKGSVVLRIYVRRDAEAPNG